MLERQRLIMAAASAATLAAAVVFYLHDPRGSGPVHVSREAASVILYTVLLASVEEFVFRELPSRWMPKYGFWWPAAFSTLLFATIHFPDHIGKFLITLCIAATLLGLRLLTGSLILCVCVHSAINLVVKTPEVDMKSKGVVVLLVLLSAPVLFSLAYRKHRTKHGKSAA
jgi:membrane protease YdiL (CAAX protease family)